MAEIEINSFFTMGGLPATDIDNNNPQPNGNSYPLCRIWEINGSTYDLVVGAGGGSGLNADALMVPITDAGQEDGFYSFLFTTADGYDETKKYLVRSDGGTSLSPNERFQVAQVDSNIVDAAAIADAVWDEQITDHLSAGSTGLTLSQIKADTTQLFLDVDAVQSIVDLILKYDTNRTRIDPTAKTLTVFDDDCTTPLRVFDLKDSTGAASVDEVCERTPVSASDGHSVCP